VGTRTSRTRLAATSRALSALSSPSFLLICYSAATHLLCGLSCSSLLPPAPPTISATTGADGVEGFACHHHAYMMPARSTGIGRWLGQGLVVAVAMHARGCPSCTHGHRSDAPRAHTVEGGLDSRHETRGWCLWRSTVHDASLTPEHPGRDRASRGIWSRIRSLVAGVVSLSARVSGEGRYFIYICFRKKKKSGVRGPTQHQETAHGLSGSCS
jgi:hypothetical protein